MITTSSIRRALVAIGWSKKAARQRAKEQNADLRDYYLHNLSEFQSYHLIYVDESGCDKRVGFRRTGWALLAELLCKLLSSIATSDIRYYPRILKMGSSSRECSAALRMLSSLRTS
jgi:hypothetical protein